MNNRESISSGWEFLHIAPCGCLVGTPDSTRTPQYNDRNRSSSSYAEHTTQSPSYIKTPINKRLVNEEVEPGHDFKYQFRTTASDNAEEDGSSFIMSLFNQPTATTVVNDNDMSNSHSSRGNLHLSNSSLHVHPDSTQSPIYLARMGVHVIALEDSKRFPLGRLDMTETEALVGSPILNASPSLNTADFPRKDQIIGMGGWTGPSNYHKYPLNIEENMI